MAMISRYAWLLAALISTGCSTAPRQPVKTFEDGYRAGVGVCTQAMADAQGWIDNEKKRSDDMTRKLNECLEADARNGHGK